ncbi:hypothetical protein CK501_08070 [Halovibrio salipaludis]|uniref:Uncharacterized protein n=1 Tax=Halovibrio salipaludis TaxID=2032626 RepID=A0A2A2F6N9_9GAMM|nr:hypothetical protein [Halovibrio salipaludis]PAU80394.1 hypothetical protein CK501_08070 [Halovibrio salipaludis]
MIWKTSATTLILLLMAATAFAWAGESRELNLNASNGDLGLGGLRQWNFHLTMDGALDPADAPEKGHARADSRTQLNLDRFLFSGRMDNVSIRFGHHQAARQGLLFDGDTDWGLSATSDVDPLNSNISVFAVSTGEAPDTAREIRLSGDAPWYTGGVWESTLPIAGSDTTVWAGYVTGSRSSLAYQQGYSVGMQSSWNDDRLRLTLERATSRRSTLEQRRNQKVSDTAHTAALRYRPETRLPFLGWEFGAEAEHVGDAFHTPGNPAMTGAHSSERLFLNLTPFDNGSLGYSYRQLEERYGPHRVTSHGNELFAGLTLSPWGWLSLQPYGEFEHREYGDLDMTGQQSLFRLTADAWLIPDKLVYRNTFKLSRTREPGDSLKIRDRRRQYLGGELQWQALSPTHNRTGLDVNLSFSADRHESRFNRGDSLDDYQVLLSISSGGEGGSRIW